MGAGCGVRVDTRLGFVQLAAVHVVEGGGKEYAWQVR